MLFVFDLIIFCTNLPFLQDVVGKILDISSQSQIDYVGHRVVHGGELFRDVTEITEESLKDFRRTEGMRTLNIFFIDIFQRPGPPSQSCSDQCHQTNSGKVIIRMMEDDKTTIKS